MRSAPAVILVLAVGCKGEPFRPDAKIDADVDAAPPWWTPEPGEAANWDIQLTATNFTEARGMYVVELWDVVPAQRVIDYGDGAPVTVPAGPLAGTIDVLHARSPRPIVVCHVDTGAIELDDPDAMKYPGYVVSPPDDPIPPASGSVIGWSTGDPNERFLDVRIASRGRWSAIMWKRLDLAQQLGCDAIEGDHNDHFFDPFTPDGFDLVSVPDEQTSWFEDFATQVHARGLSAGMKNGHYLPQGQTGKLVGTFDWIMIERCAENTDCDAARPFGDKRKAVFAIDYMEDFGLTATCEEYARQAYAVDGLHKDLALSSAYRMTCP